MKLIQHPRVRSFVRRSGMRGIAYGLSSSLSRSNGYEDRFASAMLSSIRPGDCVWDVGANVGFYTCKFAELVGPSGRVVAFEPFADSFETLRSSAAAFPQVQCVKSALGAADQDLKVSVIAPGDTGNNLWRKSDSGGEESICVKTGATLIEEGTAPPPNILKIDVEGFEEDVLWGFRDSLRNVSCRAVFIEVHYGLLEQRGFLRAPSRVVTCLRDLGYLTRWLDPSHLSGTRTGTPA